jgi:cyclic-di-AMP phosphodiesterase PgpH
MIVMTKKDIKKKKQGSSKPLRTEFLDTANSGPVFCVISMLLIAVLGGLNFGPRTTIYMAGEVSASDIAATQDLLMEDKESTARKRTLLGEMQPPVYDLSMEPFQRLKSEALRILEDLKGIPPAELNQKRWEIAERINTEISIQSLEIWAKEEFAGIFANRALPQIESSLSQGVVQDRQFLRAYKNGILIRDLSTGYEKLFLNFMDIPDIQGFKDSLDVFMREDLNLKLRARRAVFDLIDPFLRPNMTINQELSLKRSSEIQAAVEPVFYQIKKGEIIVRQGERVTEDQQRTLQALFSNPPSLFRPLKTIGVFGISTLLFLGLYLTSRSRVERQKLFNRDYFLLSTVLLSFAVLAKFTDISGDSLSKGLLYINPEILPYSLPIAGAAGLLSLFFPPGLCMFGCLLLSYMGTVMTGGSLELFLFFFLTGLLNIFLLQQTVNRTQILKTIFPLSVGFLLIWMGVSMTDFGGHIRLWTGSGFVLAGSVLSLFVLLAFSPIVEHTFGYTSRFKLMELMNLEQPLLQDLMVNAPGTYHHSLIVANLVEAGARAIGAQGLLVKVAALYHDIGKLKNPEYFIENQFGGKNKHDKLSPSMSALILTAHVKKGVEMAREHKLGQEITDLIQQHHGTSLISFFYNKAKETKGKADGEVREEEFRYTGPKPQTKEAGLILLADVIEASSRTLVDPTSSRLKGHIKTNISRIYAEGQLDDSELTLKELNQLGDVFHRILTGIFHQRVEYPKMNGKNGEKKEEQSKRG